MNLKKSHPLKRNATTVIGCWDGSLCLGGRLSSSAMFVILHAYADRVGQFNGSAVLKQNFINAFSPPFP
jgi:hypothetical protein